MKNQLMQIRKTDDLIDIFVKEYGYHKEGQESSHMIYKCNGKPPLSIPKQRELSDGVKRNLVKLVLGQDYYNKG